MKEQEILDLFKKSGALLEGHFELSSGLHSPKYLQCALVLQHPEAAQKLGQAIAALFKNEGIDIVIGPALGGVVIGYEVARALGVPGIFTERKEGKMLLRRGFEIPKNSKVLIVEDVITTGGSTAEVVEIVKSHGGKLIGVASIINRSGKDLGFDGQPLKSLMKMDVPAYQPNDCPLCKQGTPAIKPGSRAIQ